MIREVFLWLFFPFSSHFRSMLGGVFAAVSLTPPCFFLENFYVRNKAAATYVSCVWKQMLGGIWELLSSDLLIEIEKSPSVGSWCLAAALRKGERETIPYTANVHRLFTWHRPSRQSSSQVTKYKGDCTALEAGYNWVYGYIYRISPLSWYSLRHKLLLPLSLEGPAAHRQNLLTQDILMGV